MKRLRNWEPKLNRALLEMRTTPFEYGVSDCALQVCNVVKAITGIDPGKDLRGEYDKETIPDLESIAGMIAEDLLLEEVHPSRARRGDVVLMDIPKPRRKNAPAEEIDAVMTIIGIVDMTASKVVFPLIGGGVARYPVARGRRAWRI